VCVCVEFRPIGCFLLLSGNIHASGRCKILSQPEQSPRPTHPVSWQSENFAAAGQISRAARASFPQLQMAGEICATVSGMLC
jgi:hypothetical protein